MAWAWCLPTGFSTPLTYYYVVYFGILLTHRQLRDDEACHKKWADLSYQLLCGCLPYTDSTFFSAFQIRKGLEQVLQHRKVEDYTRHLLKVGVEHKAIHRCWHEHQHHRIMYQCI